MLLPDDKLWHVHHGDCIRHMPTMPAQSVDFCVFSPPFPSLFAYTSEACDLGNSDDLYGEAKLHLAFFYRQLVKVMKPGRIVTVHVCQIPALKRNNQDRGIFDFRGLNIRLARRAGFDYEYDWLVTKNPQAQAIRTHSHRLLFATLGRDRTVSNGALCDYLIKFRAPGENAVPVNSPEISREKWIDWAEGAWTDIRESDVLNAKRARGEGDVKHICPLQLEVIDRLVMLYSNPEEIVFSPFAGIGSEGYIALKRGRRFYGIELKPEYHGEACRNLDRAVQLRNEDTQPELFAPIVGGAP